MEKIFPEYQQAKPGTDTIIEQPVSGKKEIVQPNKTDRLKQNDEPFLV